MNHPKIRNCYFIICNISESDAKFIHMTFFSAGLHAVGIWLVYTSAGLFTLKAIIWKSLGKKGDCDAQRWPRTPQLPAYFASSYNMTNAAE